MIALPKEKLDLILELLSGYYTALDNILYKHMDIGDDMLKLERLIASLEKLQADGEDLYQVQTYLNLDYSDYNGEAIADRFPEIEAKANSVLYARGVSRKVNATIDSGGLIVLSFRED